MAGKDAGYWLMVALVGAALVAAFWWLYKTQAQPVYATSPGQPTSTSGGTTTSTASVPTSTGTSTSTSNTSSAAANVHLTLKVTNTKTQAPIVGASIECWTESAIGSPTPISFDATQVTDGTGSTTFAVYPEQIYWVQISASGYTGWKGDWVVATTDQNASMGLVPV